MCQTPIYLIKAKTEPKFDELFPKVRCGLLAAPPGFSVKIPKLSKHTILHFFLIFIVFNYPNIKILQKLF